MQRRIATCIRCGEERDRSAFRNRVDWRRPECRACIVTREEQEYREWQERELKKREQRHRERENMAWEDMEAHWRTGVMDRLWQQQGGVPDSLTSIKFEGAGQVGKQRFEWAAVFVQKSTLDWKGGIGA